MRKRILWVSLVFSLVLSNVVFSAPVIFMTLNDVHSGVAQREASFVKNGEKAAEEAYGLARAATVIRRQKAATPGQVIVAQMGDINEGPLFVFYKGQVEATLLNMIPVNVGTIGNHEFDSGIEGFRRILGFVNFPILSSNLKFRDEALTKRINRYYIRTMEDGTKVGLFGLTTNEIGFLSAIEEDQYYMDDVEEAALAAVADLKDYGCQVIVAMSHLGLERDVQLASRVSGIHAILGGHSHTVMEEMRLVNGPDGWKTAVTQAGSHSRYVGKVVVDLGSQDEPVRWELIELRNYIPEAKDIIYTLNPYLEKLERDLGEPIGFSKEPFDLTKPAVRAAESPFGSFTCDAIRERFGTDIAVINGGGYRGDRVYPAGDISYKTIYEIFPYNNNFSIVNMKGRDVVEMMEISASAIIAQDDDYISEERASSGGFLQISGIRVTLEPGKSPTLIDNRGNLISRGNRVRSVEILDENGGYSAIDPEKDYSLVTNEWITGGGDKYYVFKNLKRTDTYVGEIELFADYIRQKREISLPPLGRMIFLK